MQNNLIESCKNYMLIGGDPLTPQLRSIVKNEVSIRVSNEGNKSITPSSSIKNAVSTIPSSIKNAVGRVRGSPPIDDLFWCFFIILNGQHEYEIDCSFKREKEFKIGSIEKLRNIKSELKALKLRLSVIEDELLNQNKLSIISLTALCLLHKINILYVWNRKYFEIINNADEKINIILNEDKENKISYDTNLEKINYYRENYWCIDNISKPLKSVTGYTHKELLIIAQKLDICDMSSKKTKKEIYEKILEMI